MFTLLEQRGLPPTTLASLCAERPARFHGLAPKKGTIRIGADADLLVLERGIFPFDARTIQDREDARWSPYEGMTMAGRVAASFLRGTQLWDGERVLARPGRFLPRQHRDSFLG
jgi:allantoinase